MLFGAGSRFHGVLNLLEKEYATTGSEPKRRRLETYRAELPCPECGGSRLRPEARWVRIAGRAIHKVTAMTVVVAREFFAGLSGAGWDIGGSGEAERGARDAEYEVRSTEYEAPSRNCDVHCDECAESNRLPTSYSVLRTPYSDHSPGPAPKSPLPSPFREDQFPIARPILTEIAARLDFLDRVGLGYLTLDRPASTLSGGELQRVRLAAGLGSGLVGVCYVLDEPSIGLHPRDNQRLIDTLRQLQARGNTVVVVEHDERIMRRADWLVDLGPGAGRRGGRVVAGPARAGHRQSRLADRAYLCGREQIPLPGGRRRVAKSRAITLEGVTTNNLKDLSVQFPLSAFVCVTGVSGSGKSSLLSETLAGRSSAGWAASHRSPART